MKADEFRQLFGVDNTELNSIIRGDAELLKKKYREAVKLYHPDNIENGNAERFKHIHTVYNSICSCGIGAVLDFDNTQVRNIFEVREMQSDSAVVTDINGVCHVKKNVITSDNTYVAFRVMMTVDDVEYDYAFYIKYRLDNKYYVELRPLISKADFLNRKEHNITLEISNSLNMTKQSVNWTGNIASLELATREQKLILKAKVTLQLVNEVE